MTKELTQCRLKHLLNYDRLTGLFTWLVSTSPRVYVGKVAGTINHDGYRCIAIDGRIYRANRLAWFYVKGLWPIGLIDHVDNDRSNNSWDNLREANHSQNQHNKSLTKKNTSGVKGVSWSKRDRKWRAQCMVSGKNYSLGYFTSIEEASEAVMLFRVRMHGDFARHK